MDFIETAEGTGLLMELKYCERCGGLFIRVQGNHRVHCSSCVLQVERIARPTTRRSKPRVPRGEKVEIPGEIGPLLGVAEMEVWA
jgi:protein-arginine kinase activator protein McsA